LIKPEEIYDSVIHLYYRPLTKKLYEYLQSIKTDDESYKEKLEKNINFMENFDLNVLEETYIKTFYYQSNKIGKNFTLCIKPSFLPFVNINPYYNRDELIQMFELPSNFDKNIVEIKEAKMKDNKHIKSFGEFKEKLNISDVMYSELRQKIRDIIASDWANHEDD
jgi:hypothetical protein